MSKVDIKGVLRTSMLDYPGRLASVIFLSRCNFRCSFCHNPELVLEPESLPSIPEEELFKMMRERKGWVEAVVISGGEPTLHEGLPQFIKRLKDLGLKVKLDTNGTNPKMIKELLAADLLDFVAMDIKTSKREYAKLTGSQTCLPLVEESVELLKQAKIEVEFRTTAVPGLFDEKIAQEIGEWIGGAKPFALQQFHSENLMVDKKLVNKRPFTPDELKRFSEIFKPFAEKVIVRGI